MWLSTNSDRKFRVTFSLLFLKVLLTPSLVNGLGVSSSNENINSGGSYDDSVKCVCDGGCEHLRESDCPFGLTFDMCRCCLVCARGERDPCGGALGNCAPGLHCKISGQSKNIKKNGTADPSKEGHCSRDGGCLEVAEQFGCVLGAGGNCICSSQTGCPGEEMFLFETEDDCRSRMAFLIAKKDLELEPLPPLTATGTLSNSSERNARRPTAVGLVDAVVILVSFQRNSL